MRHFETCICHYCVSRYTRPKVSPIKKTCKQCKKKYITKRKVQKFCSKSCAYVGRDKASNKWFVRYFSYEGKPGEGYNSKEIARG